MTKGLVITHNTDLMQVEEAISVHDDIENGYIFSTPNLILKKPAFDKFIEDVKSSICELEYYHYNKSKNSIFEKYLGESVRIFSSGSSVEIFSSVVAKTEKIASEIWKIYLKYAEKEDEVSIYMHSYFINNGQLDDSSAAIKSEDLEYISKKYYPYIDTDVMFEQFFTGSENILLLAGAPGLGKSKMATLALKHAYNNPDIIPYDKMEENSGLDNQYINCVYVKSTDVLVNDKFWRELAKSRADFCIIDDLDYMLTKRDAEVQSLDDVNKNVFLNQFLSFTDGVEKYNTKFIITTNQKYDDIDTALLREGRLFDILEFRELKNTEALDIWEENSLSEKDFNGIFNNNFVSPAKLGSEISKRLNKRITTATKPYLFEEGISKVKVAGKTKKISL